MEQIPGSTPSRSASSAITLNKHCKCNSPFGHRVALSHLSNFMITQIVWFKRDLRVEDHLPLATAAKSGRVLPLYIVEDELWRQPDRSLRQWQFARDSLLELRHALAELGQPLLVRAGDALEVFERLREQLRFQRLLSHEETGTSWTRSRDQRVAKWCQEREIHWREFPSNGVVRGLKSRDDWAGIRDQRMRQPVCRPPEKIIGSADWSKGAIPHCASDDLKTRPFATCQTQRGGRSEGLKLLESFLHVRARHYNGSLSRPMPSPKFCSRLSAHLCFGTLSLREVEQKLSARRNQLMSAPAALARPWRGSLASFQSRIAWRCHFTQKLEDHPSVEFQCLHSAFEGLREPHFDQKRFDAWREGQTGYPLVDACMRWLHESGWLTFRMRAMLAAFASYHLWLDWRPTSLFLAQMFTDYEPGIHYPQFQMQSGVTGINATRMYNPTKQAAELDEEGAFIREYVPELARVPTTWIHRPWEMPANVEREIGCQIGRDYPAPIVEHSRALSFARGELAAARRSSGFKEEARRIFDKLGSRKKRASKRGNSAEKSHIQLTFDLASDELPDVEN